MKHSPKNSYSGIAPTITKEASNLALRVGIKLMVLKRQIIQCKEKGRIEDSGPNLAHLIMYGFAEHDRAYKVSPPLALCHS